MKFIPGDIVVWYPTNKTKSWISKAIAWILPLIGQGGGLNKKSASHIAIVSQKDNYCYESTWPKSRHHEVLNKDTYEIVYYRHPNLKDEDRDIILKWCQDHMNRWYDIVEILTLGLINIKKYDACSEFVRKAYESAGIILGKKGEYLLSPNEIVYETKPKLTKLG